MVTGVTAWETDVLPGYRQHTIELGPDPEGEGDLVATLVRRGEAGRGRAARCWQCTATPTTSSTPNSRTISPAGDSRSTRSICTNADGRGGRARRRTSPPTWRATTRELERALAVIAAEIGGATCCVYGHSAGGLIVTLWLDRLRSAA